MGGVKGGFQAYEAAFAAWADRAEIEVAGASDSPVPTSSMRSKKPVRQRAPTIPNLRKNPRHDPNAVAGNLLLKIREVANQLTLAWKDDGKARIKLKNTARRIVRNTSNYVADKKAQNPDTKDTD